MNKILLTRCNEFYFKQTFKKSTINFSKKYFSTTPYINNLYSWGCGKDGKLGIDNELIDFESFPTKLTKISDGVSKKSIEEGNQFKIRDLICGHYHTMFISADNKLYTCGWTSFTAMENENKETNFKSFIPTLVTPLKDYEIQQVAGGRRHTLVLTRDNRVFAFGVGSEYQLGLGNNENQPIPIEIKSLSNLPNQDKVIKLTCGWGHSLALTKSGDVYSWGFTQDSQTGHGFSENPITIPTKIETPYKFKNIFTGSDFNIAITDKGQLCSWGSGEFGQLGHNNKLNVESPKLMELSPQLSTSPSPLLYNNDKMIACGFSHSIIIDNDGKLLTIGWNGNGQLGNGKKGDQYQLVPTKMEFDFNGEKVIKVSAGRNHSACITESGKFYIWGNGNKGKLGNGNTMGDQLLPLELTDIDENNQIIENQKVLNLSCGFDHTIIELQLKQ